MVLLDANIVLRYLLEDIPESTIKATAIIDSENFCGFLVICLRRNSGCGNRKF